MLTQEQIDLLTPLMEHPKFGNLLKEAVKAWSQENVTPLQGTFGIISFDTGFYHLDSEKGCCLLGAALLDKENPTRCYYYRNIESIFGISYDESVQLHQGFDGEDIDCISEAYKFGVKVRQIVNPKEVD